MPYNGKRFNVTRREDYTTSAGEKKTKWVRVGVVFFEQGDEKAMLKLDLFEQPFYLFTQKDKDDTRDGGYGG